MKIIKFILVIVLAAVMGLYGYLEHAERTSGSRVPPVISCDSGLLSVSVADDEQALMAGITAKDAQDGDLTDHVLISGTSKMYGDNIVKVTYLVFDSDQNVASLTREVRYSDYRSPRISILKPLIYNESEQIPLLDRIQITDCIDGDITGNLRISYLNSTEDPEVFTANVQVTNSMGTTIHATIPILRLSNLRQRPVISLTSCLEYLPLGSAFSPENYISKVTTPDGNVSKADVEITGNVDTSTAGTYYVFYSYTYYNQNNQRLVGRAVLTVIVE